MSFKRKRMFWGLIVILLLAYFGPLATADTKPYRVLVVIGDQWDDPGSYNIDSTRVSGEDFRDVVTMLKIWGIPFDILRLDQQRLQINRFLDGIAQPNYACVIWMADPDKLEGYSAHYQTLRDAVEDYGMSLIALFDYVKTPDVAKLLGVDYKGLTTTAASGLGHPAENKKQAFAISKEHFITAGMVGTVLTGDDQADITTVRCKAKRATQVLGTLAGHPQLVVTDLKDDVKTVWIGGDRDWLGKHPVIRKIFRNALVYCLGFGLFNDNFNNAFILVMDDMGASEHAYSLRWHYPTPSRETIVKYLVEPLAEHGFVIVQNVTPGYANPVTRMVESPWEREKFIDPFGNLQDYASTKEGLDEGLRRGVFEMQPHRVWTHQTWDMDSPPGPWWDAPIEGERADGRWYQETYDSRRDTPVPSNDMLFLYKVGRSAIEKQFGVTPLGVTIRPRTGLYDDNGRLAAIAGFGLGTSSAQLHYLGTDCTIQFSMMFPERYYCHDLDLIKKIDSEITRPYSDLEAHDISELRSAPIVGSRRVELWRREWIESRKDKRWMGYNEVCAYVHSDIGIQVAGALTMLLDYDSHYCRYFSNHKSTWTIELSDRYRKKLGRNATIIIDGKSKAMAPTRSQAIDIPAGVGRHRVVIKR
ncbi:MAG: hypothetical protein ACYSUB_03195 [Planctomycetota bacterium]